MNTGPKKLADWIHYSRLRERDAYLSRAADYADFQRRIRIWEDREREPFSHVRIDHW